MQTIALVNWNHCPRVRCALCSICIVIGVEVISSTYGHVIGAPVNVDDVPSTDAQRTTTASPRAQQMVTSPAGRGNAPAGRQAAHSPSVQGRGAGTSLWNVHDATSVLVTVAMMLRTGLSLRGYLPRLTC